VFGVNGMMPTVLWGGCADLNGHFHCNCTVEYSPYRAVNSNAVL